MNFTEGNPEKVRLQGDMTNQMILFVKGQPPGVGVTKHRNGMEWNISEYAVMRWNDTGIKQNDTGLKRNEQKWYRNKPEQ